MRSVHFQFIFNVIGIVCIVVINKPLILMPTALIVVLFCFLRRIYLASSRYLILKYVTVIITYVQGWDNLQ